jgi:hypothetical protein
LQADKRTAKRAMKKKKVDFRITGSSEIRGFPNPAVTAGSNWVQSRDGVSSWFANLQ